MMVFHDDWEWRWKYEPGYKSRCFIHNVTGVDVGPLRRTSDRFHCSFCGSAAAVCVEGLCIFCCECEDD